MEWLIVDAHLKCQSSDAKFEDQSDTYSASLIVPIAKLLSQLSHGCADLTTAGERSLLCGD